MEATGMKISTIEYVIREVFFSLKRNSLMTIASIGTVTVSLFVLGLFMILIANMSKIADTLDSAVVINVYLEDELDKEDIKDLEKEIRNLKGIKDLAYIPKAEALLRFKERLGEQKFLLEALGDTNPLPNAFEITANTEQDVKNIAEKVSQMEGVEVTKYGQDIIEQLFELTKMVRILGVILLIILLLATTFIIANTIRLTVFARRKEIAIMKYVGATDWFIRGPFLIEGVVLGFFGGTIAAILLRNTYFLLAKKVYTTLTFIPFVSAYPFLLYMTISIILIGMLLGAFGSTISLKKFLKA